MWFERLIELKKSSGKTLKQISEESGVPLGTLNKLFAGQTKAPKLDTIRTVVHSLGYTLDDLEPISHEKGERNFDLNADEERLIRLYRTLNVEGRERLIETADDMVQSKKYKEVSSVRMDAKEA